MKQDDHQLGKLSDKQRKKNETGENAMPVIQEELKEMQKLQQVHKLTREELRKAMIKQTIRDNYEALERLAHT